MILLDTNVISEAMKPTPARAVMAWLDSQVSGELWTCTIVVAEIFSGLELMPTGSRQKLLNEKAELLFSGLFGGRIWSFDRRAAKLYGAVIKARRAIGRPIDEMDALIAATALANGAALATRNTADFEDCGIQLIDPWDAI